MNENVNNFHSILLHNIHVLHFWILVCICLYVAPFFSFDFECHAWNLTFTNFEMQWIALGWCMENLCYWQCVKVLHSDFQIKYVIKTMLYQNLTFTQWYKPMISHSPPKPRPYYRPVEMSTTMIMEKNNMKTC